MSPKYSILIPSKNGMPFLQAAIESVLQCTAEDIEVIVSDDASSDNSAEYLQSVSDSRVQVVEPPPVLSMSEHWDWLAGRANGQWQMFLGQDDGMQTNWYKQLEGLTEEATRRRLRAIVGKRAYFFWPGVEKHFESQRLRYFGFDYVSTNLGTDALTGALQSRFEYFELPQMYTTSFFHRGLIADIRERQGGALVVSHPQDASLAASALFVEKFYLRSELPFSWVGSSLKSAGLAIAHSAGNSSSELQSLSDAYLDSVTRSPLPISKEAGNFGLGLPAVYFWSAVNNHLARWTISPEIQLPKLPPVFVVAREAWRQMPRDQKSVERKNHFAQFLEIHGISASSLARSSLLTSVNSLVLKIIRRLKLVSLWLTVRFLRNAPNARIFLGATSESNAMTIADASKKVEEALARYLSVSNKR